MRIIKPRKCKHCCELFKVNRRNAWHQRYCGETGCQKASKAASQHKWLRKIENRSYFKGAENVSRVQQWRAAHPGYWKGKVGNVALQEAKVRQPPDSPNETGKSMPPNSPEVLALQDIILNQPLVMLGLIAKFTGTTLQDELALTSRDLLRLGRDILAGGKSYGYKADFVPDTS